MTGTDRAKREVRRASPGGSIYRHRRDDAGLMGHPSHLAASKTATVPGFVRLRTSGGAIRTGNVWADRGTGKVRVGGWPLAVGHGWRL